MMGGRWCVAMVGVVLATMMGVASAGHALHNSWSQLDHLWQDEVQVVDRIRTVIGSLDQLNGILRRYVASWEEVAGAGLEVRHGDPAAAYALLRHVATGWKHVDPAASQTLALMHHVEHLATRADREPLPNSDDVTGASEALALLAHVYPINTTALARGAFLHHDGHHYHQPHATHALSATDLASIGLVAINKGYFGQAVEFLRAARTRVDMQGLVAPPAGFTEDYTIAKLDNLLHTAIKVHDHVLDVRGQRSLTHATSPTPYAATPNMDPRHAPGSGPGVVVGMEYLRQHSNKTWMVRDRPLVELQQVERLCRGEDLRPAAVISRLVCGYSSGGSAWLHLAPFKVEVVSLEPYIAVVYDVVAPQEAEAVKTQAGRKLDAPHRDTNATDGGKTPSLKHTWMTSGESSVLEHLGRRLGHLLGVNLHDASSEPFMVADYGVGGRYEGHRDTHGPGRRPHSAMAGERLATTLTYLDAPDAGGRTVFPWVGVGVRAVSGAAVVWWNLLASHEHDFLTRHAACPVLHGRKWIVNKWVGYTAQWRSLPCPIMPAAKVRLPHV